MAIMCLKLIRTFSFKSLAVLSSFSFAFNTCELNVSAQTFVPKSPHISNNPQTLYEGVQYAQHMLNVDDRVALKNLYYRQNNFAESPLVLECYALNFSALGWFAQSVDTAYAATRKAPKNPHIAATVAYVLGVNKGNNTALRIIDKCLKEYPLDVRSKAIKAEILYALGNEENVDRILESARKLDPDSFDVASAQKWIWLKRLERDKALNVLNEYLARHPRDLRALIARSELYRQLVRFDNALADVDTVLAIMPRHNYAVALKAELLKFSKKYDQSAIFYRKYVSLAQNESDKVIANEGLAKVLEASGKAATATAARESLIKMQPGSKRCASKSEARNVIKLTKNLMSQQKWTQAITQIDRVLSSYPDMAEAIEQKAQCLDNLGQYPAAIKEISKLLELHNDYSDWYRWRARLYQKERNMPAALKDLRRASDLDGAL